MKGEFKLANNMSANMQYRKIVEKKIMRYLLLHGRNDCAERAIVEHVAKDPKVQEKRKGREYEMSDEAYGVDPDSDFYRGFVRSVLEEMRREKKILKIRHKNGRNQYAYIPFAPKPVVNDIANDEIAIFHVKSGDVMDVRNAIRQNLEDKNVVVIPMDSFLLCTMKNPRNYVKKESQLPHIRKQVRAALRSADYKIYSKAASDEYREDDK